MTHRAKHKHGRERRADLNAAGQAAAHRDACRASAVRGISVLATKNPADIVRAIEAGHRGGRGALCFTQFREVAMTQYLTVKIDPNRDRYHTYHNDGFLVDVGDIVKVPLPNNRSVTRQVRSISFEKPDRATKQIMRIVKRAEPEPEPMLDEEFSFPGEEPKNG